MHRLLFSPPARRAFRELSQQDSRRVKEAFDRLQHNPRTRGVVALQDLRIAQYRYRVRDYRILFDINDREQVVLILDIRRRSETTYR
ncbi:MAG: type II toxin-antitoxin system RelE/ParE family toxin [Chloroflexi bacterium]|nr:type II toxin-antitoxin system RelE/ParE family toxin [Chloroflexota bacterium]